MTLNLDNEKTIYNWITQLGIECAPKYQTSLFGSLFWIGALFSSILMTFTSRYGRRINMLIGTWLTVIVFTSMVFVTNLYIKYIFVFLHGFLYLKNVQSFVLTTELVYTKHRVYVTTALLALNAMIFPISAFYFRFISKEWLYLFIAFLIITFIIAILSHFVPESPVFLAEKEKYEEAKEVIKRMAKMNGKTELLSDNWILESERENWILESEDENGNLNQRNNKRNKMIQNQDSLKESASEPMLVDNEDSSTISEINAEERGEVKESVEDKEKPFKIMKSHPIILINLLIIMISWISTSFNNYLLGFNIRNLGGNFYYNAWAYGL